MVAENASGVVAPVSDKSSPTQGSPAAPVSAEPSPSSSKMYKVVIDGVESEVDEDTLKRDYQKAKYSHKRMEEAAAKERQANAIMDAIKKGDLAYLKKNVDKETFKKVATEYLLEDLEYESLPQEKKDLLTEKQKREAAEARLEELTKKDRDAEHQKRVTEVGEKFDKELGEAIKEYRAAGEHIDYAHLHRTAQLMEAAILARKGDPDLKPLPVKEALRMALKEDGEAYQNRLKSIDVEKFLASQPKERVEEFRKYFVKLIQGGKAMPLKSKEPTIRRGKQPLSIDEAFKQLEKKFGA